MSCDIIVGGKVMKGYIRAQAIIFGDFSNYIINSKSVFELMDKMKEYEVIPNVIDEVQIDIKGDQPTQRLVKRVDLESIKHQINISITQDNIFVVGIPAIQKDSETATIDIKNFIVDVKNVLNILLNILKVKATRASLITAYLDENNLKNQYEKYAKPEGFYKGKDVFEWNLRSVVREKINIQNEEQLSNEEINIVYNISRSKGVFGSKIPKPENYSFDGVLNEIDINTIPENISQRIDENYINNFYDIALAKKDEIEGMIGDEK